jgi:organic hydroperoxide reductase OsmC/OhrA
MPAIYTARSHAVGGREGTAKTDDGHLDVKLGYPKSMGGNGEGTNPEQLFAEEATGFHIGARLTLNAPDLDAETAEKLLHAAHQVCPYSKATRGNIEVDLKVA